jgi:hypothetical protein
MSPIKSLFIKAHPKSIVFFLERIFGRSLLTMLVVGMNLAACSNIQADTPMPAITPITVESLYHNRQCGLQQQQIQWLDSREEYLALFAQLRKSYIGKQTIQPPAVDFANYGVLLLAMGRKATGGYVLELADGAASVTSGVLRLTVQWLEPRPGTMVTQVLTSPCLLLRIPRAEFDHIEVKDEYGTVRMRTAR